MSKISLILPTYNERGNIESLIHSIFSAIVENLELIVVDDNSPDGTWQAAQNLCKTYPGLKVFRRTRDKGLRSAIQYGIDQSGGELVGWMDSDGSMPPQLFAQMVQRLSKADLAVGSRYIAGGMDGRNLLRRLSSRLINGLGRCILGTQTSDLTSGFILSRKVVLEKFRLRGHYGEYCVALICQAELAGFRVVELPYGFYERKVGQSKTFEGLFSFFFLGANYVGMIFKLFWEKYSK